MAGKEVSEGDGAVMERFWNKVSIGGPDECWEWTAGRRCGYGRFRLEGRTWEAHRISYELLIGKIPEGFQVDHLCRNTGCVNPAHLEPVTARENIMRGVGPTAVNAQKTHCIHGHEFSESNTIRWGKMRNCRECGRIRGREAYARAKEETA